MVLNKSTILENIERDNDNRGYILSIVDNEIKNVSIIFCEKGSLRSNHYHNRDFHYMYVLEGEIDYFFKEIDSETVNYLNVKKGQTVFTPNLEIHATYFPLNTKLIVSSKNPRDKKTYENDTVRVDFVNNNNLKDLLSKYKYEK